MHAERRSGPRERFREQARAEAKRVALDQLAESGPAGVSVNSIAKRMGITGPALYRYFENRDALLTELVSDAYQDLAEALEEASEGSRRKSPPVRFRELAHRFRSWALEQPHRYLLLFGTPVPGYRAPGLTLGLADRAMRAIIDVVADLAPAEPPAGRSALDRQLASWRAERGDDAQRPPAVLRRALLTWTRLHGLVSLEVEGQFTAMGVAPELLFRLEVQTLLDQPWD
ncbi:TetR family transcriptional regulator [Saccharopolyspora erythraea NRRL 2338]|uniref:TetR-family transcriptional regulator n=2 Tax=Saccharopolyspora erythraea TaxID=1836 RepID=A4FP31_SACEN|nr:TetR/AcrR family transcriptional regulator [Saccharopolyspora erythraea]EQD83456.1 TetR family transcriptional regulator [Saccharopolyspora erythraea D]PFG99447.1 TetR family transcriptional regulator [Saccharopolyspora erythraea NRRL 2338]QRK89356.1 TetR/AcrR family transcriptional regulator [Saccharopolyspora erythraea]CAM05806.1 TetR-family transcriptional regulator [Saccharopolyspora erythraea NRRL 2338]